MSDSQNTAGLPGSVPTPNQTQPATAATEPATDPTWLNQRIAQAKGSAEAELLKQLGVNSLAEAKALADAAKAKAEAEKTAEQRAAEYAAQLQAAKQGQESTLAVVREHAARMMAVLTPEQSKAVKDIAGDDPARQLSSIHALMPTWANAQQATQAAPVTTMPPAGMPNGDAPIATSARATYEAQRNTNPFAAALFGQHNPDIYNPK